ncbi:MAG: hypothetical protein ACM3QW_08840 [Ignavibacteriales bacterium]
MEILIRKKTRIITTFILASFLVLTLASCALAGADGSPTIILKAGIVFNPDTLPSLAGSFLGL